MPGDLIQSERYSNQRKGLAISLTGGILFTFDIPLVRLAQGETMTVVFVRGMFMFAALFLFWLFVRRRQNRDEPFINGWAGWVVVVTNTLANLAFLAALNLTAAANVAFILAFNPIFCAMMGWFVLKERIQGPALIAVIAAIGGVSIIFWDSLQTGTYLGDLLALGVALCTATALTVVRMTGKNIVNSLAVGSLVSALVAAYWAEPGMLDTAGWGWLAINGFIVIPLASALIALGPRYLPAAEVAIIFLLEPVLVPVWIWMIFGEWPTRNALIGGSIIVLALLGLGFWRYRNSVSVRQANIAPESS